MASLNTYNCKANDRNAAVTKMSQEKCPKCFSEKNWPWVVQYPYILYIGFRGQFCLWKLEKVVEAQISNIFLSMWN